MAVLIPLSFLRHLHSLRHTSYVALFSVGEQPSAFIFEFSIFTPDITAYLVTIVITCYFDRPEGTESPGEVRLVHFTPNFVSTFPVQVFAFTCAQNVS